MDDLLDYRAQIESEGGRLNKEMKTFLEFVQTKHQTGMGLLQHFNSLFSNIDQYDKAMQGLLADLSRDHGPVEHAYKKYRDSLESLRHTIQTAIQKDTENPERGDHPPKTISPDPRD
jgi:hypothetical protein